jgi:hypothetical protein
MQAGLEAACAIAGRTHAEGGAGTLPCYVTEVLAVDSIPQAQLIAALTIKIPKPGQ